MAHKEEAKASRSPQAEQQESTSRVGQRNLPPAPGASSSPLVNSSSGSSTISAKPESPESPKAKKLIRQWEARSKPAVSPRSRSPEVAAVGRDLSSLRMDLSKAARGGETLNQRSLDQKLLSLSGRIADCQLNCDNPQAQTHLELQGERILKLISKHSPGLTKHARLQFSAARRLRGVRSELSPDLAQHKTVKGMAQAICAKYGVSDTELRREAILLSGLKEYNLNDDMAMLKVAKRAAIYVAGGIDPGEVAPTLESRMGATDYSLSTVTQIESCFKRSVQGEPTHPTTIYEDVAAAPEERVPKFIALSTKGEVVVEERYLAAGAFKVTIVSSQYFATKQPSDRGTMVTLKPKATAYPLLAGITAPARFARPSKAEQRETTSSIKSSEESASEDEEEDFSTSIYIPSEAQDEEEDFITSFYSRSDVANDFEEEDYYDTSAYSPGNDSSGVTKDDTVPTGSSSSMETSSTEKPSWVEPDWDFGTSPVSEAPSSSSSSATQPGDAAALESSLIGTSDAFSTAELPLGSLQELRRCICAEIEVLEEGSAASGDLGALREKLSEVDSHITEHEHAVAAEAKYGKDQKQEVRTELDKLGDMDKPQRKAAKARIREELDWKQEMQLMRELSSLSHTPAIHAVVDLSSGDQVLVQNKAGCKFDAIAGVREAKEVVDGEAFFDMLSDEEFLPEEMPQVFDMLLGFAEGLEELHEQGYIWRDLKAPNYLMSDSGTPLVTDFGLVCKAQGDASKAQVIGTAPLMSPEVAAFGNDPERWHLIDEKADVWALGAMLYEQFYGDADSLTPVFSGPARTAGGAIGGQLLVSQLQKVRNPAHAKAYLERYPEPEDRHSLEHLLWRCMRLDPKQRPSAREFVSEFKSLREPIIEQLITDFAAEFGDEE